MRRLAAVPLLLAFAASAFAQDAPSPAPAPPAPPAAEVDLGSPVVEALEVVAQPRGPALWKVSKGASEVVVLGGVSPVPHALVWDTGRVERALDGAKVLLVPPKPRMGVLDLLKLAVGGMGPVRQGRELPMEQTLPPALRDRFINARIASHQDAKRYARWKPFVAGFLLVNDYRTAAGLSSAKPGSTVEKLAKARNVPVKPVATYAMAPILKQAGTITDKVSLECLEDALLQVEAEGARARAASDAWAVGDLKGVRANYAAPALERCLSQAPGISAVVERGTADSVRAIQDALAKPGKAVAVVDMNFLLRPNGVLDRLKAQGATVAVPPG